MHDIPSIDGELGKTLQELNALVCRKHCLESIAGGYNETTDSLLFRGAPIEDLCLDFTLPGYPDYILKPRDEMVFSQSESVYILAVCYFEIISDFSKFQVDINNLEEYISLVVDATVKTGIMHQVEAFRAGFNQVECYYHLK